MKVRRPVKGTRLLVCLAKERITTDEPQRRYTPFTKDCEQNLRAGGILKSIVGNG
jgi:hypothetical protein